MSVQSPWAAIRQELLCSTHVMFLNGDMHQQMYSRSLVCGAGSNLSRDEARIGGLRVSEREGRTGMGVTRHWQVV